MMTHTECEIDSLFLKTITKFLNKEPFVNLNTNAKLNKSVDVIGISSLPQ
jgi:hypothetical protein